MTADNIARTPAGSPDGGKFAPKPGGSEADSSLLSDNSDSVQRQAKIDLQVDHIIITGRSLSRAQVKAIHAQYLSNQPSVRITARRAAVIAVKAAGGTHDYRTVIYDAVQSSGADLICYYAAYDAARAAAAEHLISDDPYGYTQEHHDVLTAPWDAAVGVAKAGAPMWNNERVEEAISKGYVGGTKEFAQLGADVSPADGMEAATRMLGTDKVRFAGFKMGYPTYEKK